MRHGGIVLGVIATAAYAAACTLGRDLTYVPEAQQAGGADGTDSGSSGGKPNADASMQTDAGDPRFDGGGSDAAIPTSCPPGSPAEVEPDDSSAQANVLTNGTTCGGLIVGSDNDWFKFVVGPKGSVNLAFGADADAILGFVDQESGATSTLRNGHSILTDAAAGDHFYVHIFSADTTHPSAQSYTITLDNE